MAADGGQAIRHEAIAGFGNEDGETFWKERLDAAGRFQPIKDLPFHLKRQPQAGQNLPGPGTGRDDESVAFVSATIRLDANSTRRSFPAKDSFLELQARAQ